MQRVEVLHMFFRMTEPQRAVAWLAKVDPWLAKVDPGICREKCRRRRVCVQIWVVLPEWMEQIDCGVGEAILEQKRPWQHPTDCTAGIANDSMSFIQKALDFLHSCQRVAGVSLSNGN